MSYPGLFMASKAKLRPPEVLRVDVLGNDDRISVCLQRLKAV